jgi:hypothetical protein
MHNKNILNQKQIVVLVALAEGIKTSRVGTNPADLVDLASRLEGLAKACDDRNSVTVTVNGMTFTYANASTLVTKAAAKVEAEANRLVSSTLHLIEDLYTGHASGTVIIGGIPDDNTNDIDGDNAPHDGADTEVFDRLGHKDVTRPSVIRKYFGSLKTSTDRMPTGITDGTMLVNGKFLKKLV